VGKTADLIARNDDKEFWIPACAGMTHSEAPGLGHGYINNAVHALLNNARDAYWMKIGSI
jgi:hypothetical protein